MSQIENDFQEFATRLDEIEFLAKEVRANFDGEVGELEDGVTIEDAMKRTDSEIEGIILKSSKEPVKGIGTGKVVFHTNRLKKYPPGDAVLNVYLHTDKETAGQAELLMQQRPDRILSDDICTSFGYTHLSAYRMQIISFFPALIDHPTAGYTQYDGDKETDRRMLIRLPTPEDLELLGFVSVSLIRRLENFLKGQS